MNGKSVYRCNNYNTIFKSCVSSLNKKFCMRCKDGLFIVDWVSKITKRDVLIKYFKDVTKELHPDEC